ncbi:MAG: DUF1028 domain-containing protein [Gemmatimonadales bacterium]
MRIVSRISHSVLGLMLVVSGTAGAQEPVGWGDRPDAHFATFSIVAVDPMTGETGVAVTTRVACVGNGVPWVRAGVGAVATQANTRTAYGNELLALLASGIEPEAALARAVAGDTGRDRRQVGVIDRTGRTAQHTGPGTSPWAGHRAGRHFATQGNLLVGPAVLDAVARTFEASEGSPRHLADRLIEALAAGHEAGGDARKGRTQSAAVIVADPRPGRSRREDGVTVNINVCEHPEPVAELRRIYRTISQTLGFRRLESLNGNDVWQLKVILHALGYLRGDPPRLDDAGRAYDGAAVEAVERFRTDEGMSTSAVGSPAGLVDAATVAALWAALDRAGRADDVRRRILEVTAVRR